MKNQIQVGMVRPGTLVLLKLLLCSMAAGAQSMQPYASIGEIPTPQGYERVAYQTDSYGAYLRDLELKFETTVFLYSGERKWNQTAQFAVLKIDVGTRDLQQCADACMRLRAEYLFGLKQYDAIKFNFVSDGKPRYFLDYAKGDLSYAKFRKYMDYVFSYASTASLHDELQPASFQNLSSGDILVQKRNPYGHAITVMDVAKNDATGELIYLLAQSYMPAQDIHVLNNPNTNGPWYYAKDCKKISTPEWEFIETDLRRF